MTLWVACIGLSFTVKLNSMAFIAAGISILYWIFEGLIRFQYWYKYVLRYRKIRSVLNYEPDKISELSVYDLTNKISNEELKLRQRLYKLIIKIRSSFLKFEPSFFYLSMGGVALVIALLLYNNIITYIK